MSSPLNASTYDMNVSMVEHQRNIMSVIGIDLWIPKTDVPTRTYTSSIYRDQALPEPDYSHNFEVENFNHVDVLESKNTTNVDHIAPPNDVHNNPSERSQVEQTAQKNQKIDVGISTEAREAVYVAPFELQALCLEHCVILVDSTQLSPEQATLWQNIQMAKPSQFVVLKWPFALASLQDGRGVPVYIQGFVDALKVDKQILSIGKISYAKIDHIIELPDLQQMLDQPLLKRKLWAYMQNSK